MTFIRSHCVRRPILLTRSRLGFTLIEVLVALCIMLIALVPLIQLHVASIRSIDGSSRRAAATVLANTLLAEILMKDVPDVGESNGRVEDAGTGRAFRWRSVVADADWAELQGADLAGLRRVHVEVVWQDGGTDATVSLDTVVYLSPSSEQKKSENEDGLDSTEKAGSRRSGV